MIEQASLSLEERMKLCAYTQVSQSCPTLCNLTDFRRPGSCVCGILQAGVLKWAAISFSRGSSPPRDQPLGSCTAGRFFTHRTSWEVLPSPGRAPRCRMQIHKGHWRGGRRYSGQRKISFQFLSCLKL